MKNYKKIKKYLNKFISNKARGFTLIEMLVAISIFVVAVTSVSAIFIAVVRSQNKSNIQRETAQDARYAMEMITRETRMATGNDPLITGNKKPAIEVKKLGGTDELILTNTPDFNRPEIYTVKRFYVNADQLMLDTATHRAELESTSTQPITPNRARLRVTTFRLENFIPLEEYNPLDPDFEIPPRQPSVTITITTEQGAEVIKVSERGTITLRTTISSRDYRYYRYMQQ